MVRFLDEGIGNITSLLKSRGMWDNTLVFVFADNGGREDSGFGGNNYPLRGQKVGGRRCGCLWCVLGWDSSAVHQL